MHFSRQRRRPRSSASHQSGRYLAQLGDLRTRQSHQLQHSDPSSPSCGGELVTPSYGGDLVSPSFGGELVNPSCGGELVSPSCGGELVSPSFGGELVSTSCDSELVTPSCSVELVTPSCGGELDSTGSNSGFLCQQSAGLTKRLCCLAVRPSLASPP